MYCRGASVVMDMSFPWPELAPPGFCGNTILTPTAFVESDGSAEKDPDASSSLQSALAQTIKGIRNTIKQTRDPEGLRKAMCTMYEGMLTSKGFLGLLQWVRSGGTDCMMTNWNHSGHEDMDFGNGSPTIFMGHFGINRSSSPFFCTSKYSTES